MSYNGVVAIAAYHLNDVIAEFAFDDGGDLSFFQPEGSGEEHRVPHFAIGAVQLDLSALVLTARVVGIKLGKGLEFFLTAFYLPLVFIQLIDGELFDFPAGFGVENELA